MKITFRLTQIAMTGCLALACASAKANSFSFLNSSNVPVIVTGYVKSSLCGNYDSALVQPGQTVTWSSACFSSGLEVWYANYNKQTKNWEKMQPHIDEWLFFNGLAGKYYYVPGACWKVRGIDEVCEDYMPGNRNWVFDGSGVFMWEDGCHGTCTATGNRVDLSGHRVYMDHN
jgi:hypothetical protein